MCGWFCLVTSNLYAGRSLWSEVLWGTGSNCCISWGSNGRTSSNVCHADKRYSWIVQTLIPSSGLCGTIDFNDKTSYERSPRILSHKLRGVYLLIALHPCRCLEALHSRGFSLRFEVTKQNHPHNFLMNLCREYITLVSTLSTLYFINLCNFYMFLLYIYISIFNNYFCTFLYISIYF